LPDLLGVTVNARQSVASFVARVPKPVLAKRACWRRVGVTGWPRGRNHCRAGRTMFSTQAQAGGQVLAGKSAAANEMRVTS
jgi:hypothetical protein